VIRIENPSALSDLIVEAFEAPAVVQVTLVDRIRSFVIERWHLKLGMLAFVSVLWLSFAGQQNFEVTLQVPLQIQNRPAHMKIIEPREPRIRITIRGLRKDASTIQADEVAARVDLTLAEYGWKRFRVTREQVVLPNAQVSVVGIEPSQITFEFEDRSEKPPAIR
jgi:hypothetical protein